MATVVNNIVRWLTGKPGLQDISVQEIQSIADSNPSFMIAQLLLATKLKEENNPLSDTQVQKTALHFQHPQWLHFQLNNLAWQEAPASEARKEEIPEDKVEQHLSETEAIESIAGSAMSAEGNLPIGEMKTETAAENHPIQQGTEGSNEEKALEFIVSDIMPEEEDTPDTESQDENLVPSRLSNLLKAQAADFKKEVDAAKPLLPDTPVPAFTKDYFKSQGIQLTENDNGELTGKVHRFTDWIKQMKRINPNPVDLGGNEDEEEKIKAKAENSNRKEEIVTEAMLEVLVRQNKIPEAISVLEKLSLQKPEKSAYFANLLKLLKQ